MKWKLLVVILLNSILSTAQNTNKSIGFIENKGQIIDQKGRANKGVKFLLNTNGLNVQLRKNGFSYDIYETKKHPLSENEIAKRQSFPDLKNEKDKYPDYTLEYIYHRIDIDFVNSNSNVSMIAEEKSTDYDNYYNVAHAPEGITNVYKYKQVTYKNIYQNIDVVFTIPNDSSKTVEYNFVIHPKGKISDIQMKFSGAKTDLVDNKIKMNVRFGEMEETIPLSWTDDENEKKEIVVGYKKTAKNTYGFESAKNVSNKTVIIDPVPIRLWGTYYGGTQSESAGDIITDSSNNVYISGGTQSASNIATSGSYQPNLIGGADGFVAKFNTDGTRLWGTYLDIGAGGIKLDSNNNIYFVGSEFYSTNLGTPGSFQPTKNNYNDAILIKLNNIGFLEWATYYGGNGNDYGYSICFDSLNNVYISGTTDSTDIFSTPGSHQEQNASTGGYQDAFIAKFNPLGNRLWGTFYGGTGSDGFSFVSVSNDGYLYAMGTQRSFNNIATIGSYQPSTTIVGGGMIVKFDLNGQRIWGTYIVESSGISTGKLQGVNLYLTGRTTNQTNIGTSNTFLENFQTISSDSQLSSNVNTYIINFNVQTQQKIWGTYFVEQIRQLDVNQNYEVYFSGDTNINNSITTPDGYMPTKGIYMKVYLLKLNSLGQRVWGTYYGGNLAEQVGYLNLDSLGNIYLYGNTNGSTTGIATLNAHQSNLGSLPDTFLAKFKDCLSATTITGTSSVCIGSSIELSATGGTNYSWIGPNGFTSILQNPIITNANATHNGQYSCAITGTGGCDDTKTIDVLVGDTVAPIPDITTLPTITGDCNTIISSIPTATDTCAGSIIATTTSALSYNLPGTYTIVWNYIDGNGNTAFQNQTVVINAQPLPTAPSPQTFCIDQNATLNDVVIAGQNIKWYDAQTGGNILPSSTILQNNATYYASQTINGCESLRIPVTINIQNTPISSGNPNQTFCSSGNPTLADIVVSGTDIIWYDSLVGGSVLPDNTPLQTNTTYYCTQTINGCESPTRLGVNVTLINTLNATNYSKTLCDALNDGSETLDFASYNSDLISDTSNCTFEYYYSFNGATNQISTEQITTVSNYNLTLGTYTIYVRITSNNGCHQIVELTFTLVSEPIIPIEDLIPICENKIISVNAGNGFDSYLWSTGETSSSIFIFQAGNYDVTVTQNHGTVTCSSTKNFTVVLSNIATITGIVTQDWTDTENVIVVNTSGVGDYEYSIDGIHFQDSNTFTDLSSGNYTVTVRDKNGCGMTSEEVFLLMYPKFFTPNGDGYNDNWNIKFSNLEPGLEVKIFDRYGKFIKELKYNDAGWDGTLNDQNLPSTDYWFVVTLQNGKKHSGHFSLKR